MTHTEPTYDLPHQIKLEFCQIEAPLDEDTRRIEIGESGMITSGDGLCVVEIQNMEGDAIATFRLKPDLNSGFKKKAIFQCLGSPDCGLSTTASRPAGQAAGCGLGSGIS